MFGLLALGVGMISAMSLGISPEAIAAVKPAPLTSFQPASVEFQAQKTSPTATSTDRLSGAIAYEPPKKGGPKRSGGSGTR